MDPNATDLQTGQLSQTESELRIYVKALIGSYHFTCQEELVRPIVGQTKKVMAVEFLKAN